ncbi:uncharacterized protein A4U43_UnF8050 [Asparagus officinalis]|uniref:Uncharacterized protein n=1 Tax=Asparagus officinalis TaxID=4686 RepID=A0A1R3L623_ASPOF|nr:uncharacterized protein A4U43_UnF8050 [Asparagus officinalis]
MERSRPSRCTYGTPSMLFLSSTRAEPGSIHRRGSYSTAALIALPGDFRQSVSLDGQGDAARPTRRSGRRQGSTSRVRKSTAAPAPNHVAQVLAERAQLGRDKPEGTGGMSATNADPRLVEPSQAEFTRSSVGNRPEGGRALTR